MPTDGKPTPSPQQDWRNLAEQASKEKDPEKLAQIVEELCGVLKLRQQQEKAIDDKKNNVSADLNRDDR